MMSVIAGGGLVALIASFWNQVKSFSSQIISLVIKTDRIVAYLEYSDCFIQEILSNSKKVNFGNSIYSARQWFHLKHYNRYGVAIFEVPRNGFYIYDKSLIFVNFSKTSISYLRGTFSTPNFLKKIWDKVIKDHPGESDFSIVYLQGESLKEIKRQRLSGGENQAPQAPSTGVLPTSSSSEEAIWLSQDCVKLIKGINYNSEDLGEEKNKKVDRILLCDSANEMFKHMYLWYNNENWFKERNIAYRGGALLYGPPGSGKSQTVKEICRKLGVRLYVFDLSTMNNQEFHDKFESCSSPSVVLFEDIDSIFDGRKNIVHEDDGLTFDCFINHISGVGNCDGKFTIVTSNHANKLDPALIRPGRLDNSFEIGYLSTEAKQFLADKILKDWPEEINKVMSEEGEFLGAEFENKCTQIAVEKFWKQIEKIS